MKILMQNKQKKVKITPAIRNLIKQAIAVSIEELFEEDSFEVSVMITDNEEIQVLNKLHRDVDKPTDVLSFPLLEYDADGEIIPECVDYNEMGGILLGDIVISAEKAVSQAEEYGHSIEREFAFLTVHSMLHLFGYDHMEPAEEEKMFTLQEEILSKKLNLTK